MKVHELIAKLQKMPPDALVCLYCDNGEFRIAENGTDDPIVADVKIEGVVYLDAVLI